MHQQQSLPLPETGAAIRVYDIPSPRGVVLICPGGSYRFVAEGEEWPVALRFNRGGYAAVTLDYACTDKAAPESIPLGTLPLRQLV
ncbi:MAG: hypothetical protein Q4C54_10515 [Clostridia bacterium]|nr:hypothetical protein [Clostridia bacterium]